ncbi:TrkA family potassium uptake protein [Candidatus Babeliales bacterium]|nr:TrkA family potassium uptake protein [Candidatus Babeliales bacterium]
MKFCVIGLGRFGYKVAETLASQGMEVLAIDRREEVVADIKDKVTQAICMTVTDIKSLEAVGVEDVDTAIVGMGKNIEQSVLITALLKQFLKITTVISRSNNTIHEEILKLVGADKVIFPEDENGERLAKNLSFPLIDIIGITPEFSITQITAPIKFVGKNIGDLKLRESRRVVCIGVKKGKNIALVGFDYTILEDDQLIFAGENHYLEGIARLSAE